MRLATDCMTMTTTRRTAADVADNNYDYLVVISIVFSPAPWCGYILRSWVASPEVPGTLGGVGLVVSA